MGASKSKCACFEGFTGKARGRVMPDTSPDMGKVSTFEEAMSIERQGEGTFVPSPPSKNTFASPVPHMDSAHIAGDDVDFDLVIDAADAPRAGSKVTLDYDGRKAPVTKDFGKNSQTRSKFEVEQLLSSPGSLPPPMSREERERALRALLPTATYQMLAKVPTDLVTAKSPEGQALRRKLMAGSTVVFISAGLPGKRFIYEKAAELGVKTVIIEHPDSWARTLQQE
eukprot:718522-Amphidinium_carterae.1